MIRGDFTRDTFDRSKGYTRVVMQQGRVQLDADWNEQGDILVDTIRQTARDIIGPHGGPADDVGFMIKVLEDGADLSITSGRYYVDGVLARCTEDTTYTRQPHFKVERPRLENGIVCLVYLDVWEREVSALQDDALADSALGGEDTSLRTQVIWQVRVCPLNNLVNQDNATKDNARDVQAILANTPDVATYDRFDKVLLAELHKGERPTLGVEVVRTNEDRLLRIEAHGEHNDHHRIKWCTHNGSIQRRCKIRRTDGRFALSLSTGKNIGSVRPGSWLEIQTGAQVGERVAGVLLKVRAVRPDEVELSGDFNLEKFSELSDQMTVWVRHWDGSRTVSQGESAGIALDELADISIDDVEKLQPGDAWAVPLRGRATKFEAAADRIFHHYAPLAIVQPGNTIGLRREFPRSAKRVQ